jgi:hypothetical protein
MLTPVYPADKAASRAARYCTQTVRTTGCSAVVQRPSGRGNRPVLLTYIELVSDAPVGELRDLAASLGPDAEAYVTTAEMLRA